MIVGYEQLARIAGEPVVGPQAWFAAAAACGHTADLSAEVVRQTLKDLDALPPNTFITINLEPSDLSDPGVLRAFDAHERLDRVVVEVTEHALVEDFSALAAAAAPLRERGARIAADDVGAGYSGLQALHAMRPDLVKLDRWVVDRLDQDAAKRMLVEMLGRAADAMDAWVLAEGIERAEELDALVDLGVPLGQGYLLARPEPEHRLGIDPGLAARLQQRHALRSLRDHAVALVVNAPALTSDHDEVTGALAVGVEVDEQQRPRALRWQDGRVERRLLVARASEDVRALARRTLTRHDQRWTDPIVIVDGRGRYQGVVPVEALLDRLSADPTES